ncbi:MAG: tyrosine-type recombinase/integrase [Spirochaetales bacterium]|nr:tyrosine-type recombinase/integrase [Candidatus Physcosoma equi]
MKEYYIYKRQVPHKNGKPSTKFYVKFVDPETRLIGNPVAVETLSGLLGLPVMPSIKKNDAERVARLALEAGLSGTKKDKDIDLVEYLTNFWDWESSDYIALQLKKNPNSLTRQYCDDNKNNILRHVIYSDMNTMKDGKRIGWYIPKGLKVTQLKLEHLEKLEKSVLIEKGLSPKSWKNYLGSLSKALEELVRKGILSTNPCNGLIKVEINQRKTTVGILDLAQTKAVALSIIAGICDGTINRKIGLALLLLESSGMRPEEVRALTYEDIVLNDFSAFATVNIDKAFTDKNGLKTTKTGDTRAAYIDKALAHAILNLKDKAENLESRIFVLDGKDKPVGLCALERNLKNVMEALSIDCSDKEGKTITLYSLRHGTNTFINSRGNGEWANLILGHSDGNAMNARYNHTDYEMEAIKIAGNIGTIFDSEVIEQLTRLCA